VVARFLKSITNTTNLGANDIYRWYLADRDHSTSSPASAAGDPTFSAPDLKLNLIYPCTEQHVRKYSAQRVRLVTETPEIYGQYIRPYIIRQREAGRLDWIFNILEGRTEQEDVIVRSNWGTPEGFLMLPDLNWDRKTVEGMHLLALVERRDIWSVRDLRKKHVPWLRAVRDQVIEAATSIFKDQLVERDELKCYLHCMFPLRNLLSPLHCPPSS